MRGECNEREGGNAKKTGVTGYNLLDTCWFLSLRCSQQRHGDLREIVGDQIVQLSMMNKLWGCSNQ